MSDLSSFQSIVDRFEAMHPDQANKAHPAPAPIAPASQPHVFQEPPPLKMQPIEDFEREQDAIEAQLAAEVQARPMIKKIPKQAIEPMGKKPKKATDPEELAAEQRALKEMESGNWIGKLQIYRDTRPVPGGGNGIDWAEGVEVDPFPRFTCTLVIHETMNRFGYETIGSSSKVVSFGNKKTAKQFAAKKAIDWLIANEYLPKDGSAPHKAVPTPQPKKVKIPPPQPKAELPATATAPKTPSAPSTPASRSPAVAGAPGTYAQRIPDLCHRLGVRIPTYHYIQDSPGPLWDAYADFGGDPVVDGRVGEVRNVFGKKNAKEEVAKLTFSFLKDIERQRMAQLAGQEVEESEEDRKRKRVSGVEGESPEMKSKSVKVGT